MVHLYVIPAFLGMTTIYECINFDTIDINLVKCKLFPENDKNWFELETIRGIAFERGSHCWRNGGCNTFQCFQKL